MPDWWKLLKPFSSKAFVAGIFLVVLMGLATIWVGTSTREAVTSGVPDWPSLLGTELQARVNGQDIGGGSLEGTARLQGREDHGRVQIALDGAPITATDPSGRYFISDVAPGNHTVRFSHPGFLTQGVYVNVFLDQTTIVDVELPAGDVNGDGAVDLGDLKDIILGIRSGSPSADVNGDGEVDVRDLVQGGRNFGQRARLPTASMQQRVDHLVNEVRHGPPDQVAAAIGAGMEILYGGLRPVLSPDPEHPGQPLPQTQLAEEIISRNELLFARALGDAARRTDLAGQDVAGLALDLQLFIEEMNEVARAVGQVTAQCGDGASLLEPPCDDLQPLLNEITGQVGGTDALQSTTISPSYSVKLRSPIVPGGSTLNWDEDVFLSQPITPGSCEDVSKETRGLMLRLRFEEVIVVRDPWVSVFGVPRGTRIPIWSLEWVPAQHFKTWSMCNSDGSMVTSVSQRVKQDDPLNFFWRMYPASSR